MSYVREAGGAGWLQRPDISFQIGFGPLVGCGTMAAMRNPKPVKPPSQTKPRFSGPALVGFPAWEFIRPLCVAAGVARPTSGTCGVRWGAPWERLIRALLQVLREGKGPMRMAVSHHRKSAPAWDAGYGATAPINIWLRGSQALLSAAEMPAGVVRVCPAVGPAGLTW